MVLQPMPAGKGGRLTHELWLDVVAAIFCFDDVDDNGKGIGLGRVWNALVHRIDFPANTATSESLRNWLDTYVAGVFEESLERLT